MQSIDRPMRIIEGPAGERHHEAAPAFQLDAVRSVRLHPKLAAYVACAVLVLTVGYALTRKPMYQAQSLSYVEPLETKLVSDGSQGIYDPARYDSYFQQQIQTATRQDILEAAIKKMPEGVWQQSGEDLHHAAERLASTLKVERVGSSYQLAISVQSDNPEKASAIVNAATNAYLEQGRKDENARSDGRLVLLQEESQRIQKELQQDREEQAVLSQTLGVADTQNGGANPYDLQLAGVRTELVAAREAHDVAAAQLASVTARGALSSAGLKAIADEAIASDTGLSALKTTINERRAVLNTQMATLTPTNPVYKQDADEIASMDKQVEARMTQLRQTAERRVEDKLRLDLQRTGDIEARLNGQLAHATAQAGSAAPKLQRAKDVAADITRLQARYATVDDALRGLQLESSGPGTAHLLVAARVPDAPEANRRLLLLALALPLAVFAGILAAVLARKSDKRLHSATDLEQALGVVPMCALPASSCFHDVAQDEHLLRLATALERGHRLNGARMFVFTAASQSMDTSGLLANVRAKLNELGFRAVVLAAADVRHMAATERKLESPSQIEQMKRENAFVLIDAMPLLHSADTEYAVSCADASLVVAESGYTTEVELKRCMILLQQLKATGVGTILLNASDEAHEAPGRRQTEAAEQRERKPMWERTRGAVEPMSVVPKWQDEEATPFKEPKVVIEEPLPKRVQLIPVAAEPAKVAPAAYPEEPFMLFEEAAAVTPTLVETVPAAKVQREIEQAPPVVMRKAVPTMAVERIQIPAAAKAIEKFADETDEAKVERVKREAIARVKARFGMPEEVVEAISAVMQKPMLKQESAFTPMVAFRAANENVTKLAVRETATARVDQASVEETIFEWHETPEPVNEVPAPQPVFAMPASPPPTVAVPQVLRPLVAAAQADLPPVRRVTVHQERPQPTTIPAVQWALQPERRRVPREPIAFPRGLNKAALRMSEKGQAIAKGQAGPSLTAAEQAVAKKVSTTHQPTVVTQPRSREASAEQAGRWNLLRRFGGFEIEDQNEPMLKDRAAG